MKLISRFTWEIIQTIVGSLVVIYVKIVDKSSFIAYNKEFKVFYVMQNCLPGSVSLGGFVLVRNYLNDYGEMGSKVLSTTIAHETGHSIQSRYLGPLYLLVIGIPSFLHAVYCKYFKGFEGYYSFYTEKWADYLGRVNR